MDAQLRQRVSLKNPTHFLALGFGTGLIPLMPGTWGTLAALPFILLLLNSSLIVYVAATVLVTLVGIWLCEKTANDMGVHDHGSIVWDEVAGMMITMIAVPISPITLLVGFLLFRVFDILKPPPIDWCDKYVGGGLGIMLDDVIAGLMALGCMHALLFFSIL